MLNPARSYRFLIYTKIKAPLDGAFRKLSFFMIIALNSKRRPAVRS